MKILENFNKFNWEEKFDLYLQTCKFCGKKLFHTMQLL